MAGAGAVRSTAHDLTVFLEACLGRRETPSQPALRQLLERRQELRGVAGGAHQRPTRQHPHHPDRRYAIAPGAGSQPASGLALARRVGKSYEALLVERISDPLDSTRITLTEDMRSRLAQGHNRRQPSSGPGWVTSMITMS